MSRTRVCILAKLFLRTVKPHNPVVPSTMARLLRSMMQKAGIVIGVFRAHSTRGAAVMAAANTGITTEDIPKAANWSSDTVFNKFYYKLTKHTKFGQTAIQT